MKLEVGKFYKTRDGRKVGPMLRAWGGGGKKFTNGDDLDDPRVWLSNGDCNPHGCNVIAEWQDEPHALAPATTRAHILDTAKQYVTKDRQATHGKPEDTFGLIAAYWSAHLDTNITSADVAAMMALLKLARAKANPTNDDNWIDLAGYAACAGELAK